MSDCVLPPSGALRVLLWQKGAPLLVRAASGKDRPPGGSGPGGGGQPARYGAVVSSHRKPLAVATPWLAAALGLATAAPHVSCHRTHCLSFQNSTECIESSCLVLSPSCLFKITNSLGSNFRSYNEQDFICGDERLALSPFTQAAKCCARGHTCPAPGKTRFPLAASLLGHPRSLRHTG